MCPWTTRKKRICLVQTAAGADSGHRVAQPGAGWAGVVCAGGGHHPEAERSCQQSKFVVVLVIGRLLSTGQFYDDVLVPETVDQPPDLLPGHGLPTSVQRPSDTAL